MAYEDLLSQAGQQFNVDPALLRLVMGQESSGDPSAVSPKGASGLMQLMPGTAQQMGVTDIKDPKQNIFGGAKYLSAQLDKYGDVPTALAAYNAGPGAVDKHGGIPPFPETQAYVRDIVGRYQGGAKMPQQTQMPGLPPTASNASGGVDPFAGLQGSAPAASSVPAPTSQGMVDPFAGLDSAPSASTTNGGGASGSWAPTKADTIRSLLSGNAPVAAMTDATNNLRLGGIRGAGSIGATLMYPIDKATDLIQGDRNPTLSGLVTGNQPISRNDERRQAMDAGLASLGADTNSRAYAGGKLGMEVAGTLGVGGALANGARSIPMLASNAAPLIDAIGTGGMSAGGMTGLPGLATRTVGGAITGGASAGLIDPKDAASGAMIGAAAPAVTMAAGKAGTYVGDKIADARAAQMAEQSRNAPFNDTLKAGIDAGYVVPPSSVNPSLWNTTKESIGGKIATAQVAAVKNQNVTDNLVRNSLGLASDAPLSVEALGKYRADQFASGYSPLRQLGTVPADQQFASDLANIGNQYTGKGTIPAIQKTEISDLVNAHQSTGFDAGDAVDAIRILRSDAQDAFKQGNSALGKAQKGIADAYEGALDRALPQGSPLLANYQNARANIAKSFTVDDALKEGTGSVDARKLATALQGGAPLSGDLLTAARFASAFPKATQLTSTVAGPGVHNLKAGASGVAALAGAHFGGPVGAAVGAAMPWVVSPAMRAQMFSKGAQEALLPKAIGGPGMLSNVAGLLANPDAQQSLLRIAPTIRPMGLLNVGQ